MKKIIKDRHDYIREYCKGKEVLHLGCICDSFRKDIKVGNWLHYNINKVAKSLEGIDNNVKNIPLAEKLSKTKIYNMDVCNFNINKKFDVIVAGEIIEHLNNFEGFFNSMKNHLKEDGVIIITTPNVFKITNIARIVLTGKTYNHAGHVVYFDIHTLNELLNFNNLQIVKHYYNTEWAKQRFRNIIIRTLGKFIPIYNLNLMVVAKIRK